MQTTGIFTIHTHEIEVAQMGRPILFRPFGDVHRSSNACDVERWRGWCSEARKCKQQTVFMGIGDYDDFVSTSERKLLCNDELHESTRHKIEDTFSLHNKRFGKEIDFMQGRLIGFVEGNHYGAYQDGSTTTMRLSEMMKTKYLGVCTFTRLSFNYQGCRTFLDVWAHHGKGAARLPGGSLNRVIQMAETAEADIFLMGHDHKRPASFQPRLTLKTDSKEGLQLKHRRQLFARTGSFLKAYEPGAASYVVDNAMGPTDLGATLITMTPTRSRKEGGGGFKIELGAVL